MKIIKTLIAMGLSVVLAACAGMSNQDVGTVAGAAAGGLLGSQIGGGSGQIVAAVAGTVIGGAIGNRIGKYMDDVDRMKMDEALENSRVGHSEHWVNPDNGNEYTVTPTKTYYKQAHSGTQPCREYTTTAIIGGKKEQIYGKACRMDDGAWKVIS